MRKIRLNNEMDLIEINENGCLEQLIELSENYQKNLERFLELNMHFQKYFNDTPMFRCLENANSIEPKKENVLDRNKILDDPLFKEYQELSKIFLGVQNRRRKYQPYMDEWIKEEKAREFYKTYLEKDMKKIGFKNRREEILQTGKKELIDYYDLYKNLFCFRLSKMDKREKETESYFANPFVLLKELENAPISKEEIANLLEMNLDEFELWVNGKTKMDLGKLFKLSLILKKGFIEFIQSNK